MELHQKLRMKLYTELSLGFRRDLQGGLDGEFSTELSEGFEMFEELDLGLESELFNGLDYD